ncbi:hybrid sensor histidine kinase/response regulator, partial [Pelomonas sp. HMWF004]
RRTPLSAQQTDWLTKLDVAGAHLLELINAVLDLSKIEAGKLSLEVADVDMGRIAARVVSMLSERAAAKQLSLSIDLQPLPQALLGDPVRLQQALLNYAVNAVKFTAVGGVTLRALCAEETAETALIRIEVQDSGGGIAPEVLPRLFTAFEQADNSTTRQHGGTGLGLTIVKQLARLMGGEAGVESTVGVGSTFWFTARLHKATDIQARRVRDRCSAEAALAREHAQARLLLVDDDAVNREVALAMLQAVIPNVDVAADGQAAIELAALHSYDLILMDMQMPGISGIEATRRIRQLPGSARTVIVALTANVFAEDRAACFAAGMNDFLAKPFTADAFFETLLRALSP